MVRASTKLTDLQIMKATKPASIAGFVLF
ncbi:hypothetical protein VCRA2113O215_360010 [Vibrio crassostreae]|nr:hypothetical protein VCRA2118O236_330010 [Vibrio crassostreae]CAK2037939.1 hypothetical protein VCRA2113O206_360009 [Vibrio crassostreae]CAK2047918.1 hypothetical protein VCRA2116O234_360010 [Vibrio crassostreae]CAK2049357.1 hypothetical protein VCRA2113O202_330010 [Vibrio crassostreae]CAK2055592.1 hypothetical protein VCRA2113O218_350010 [Vibrio crassostreae]